MPRSAVLSHVSRMCDTERVLWSAVKREHFARNEKKRGAPGGPDPCSLLRLINHQNFWITLGTITKAGR